MVRTILSNVHRVSRIKGCKTLTDAYAEYKESAKGKFVISYSDYVKICYAANKKIVEHIQNGGYFKMPYNVGDLDIKKRKVNYNNLKIDFAEFNRTGKKIMLLNEHTDGWYFKYHWDKKLCNIKGNFFYSFIPTRANTRELVRLLKSGEKSKRDYLE